MKVISHIKLMAVLIPLLIISSCGDEVMYGEEQRPVLQFGEDLQMNNIIFDNPSFVELGVAMEFLRDGRITRLCCYMPTAGVYRVTLWDAAARTVITSVGIEASLEGGCVDIPVQYVRSGDRMTVSVYTNNFFELADTISYDPIFPSIEEDVELLYTLTGVAPVGFDYPTFADLIFLYGAADIVFEPEI